MSVYCAVGPLQSNLAIGRTLHATSQLRLRSRPAPRLHATASAPALRLPLGLSSRPSRKLLLTSAGRADDNMFVEAMIRAGSFADPRNLPSKKSSRQLGDCCIVAASSRRCPGRVRRDQTFQGMAHCSYHTLQSSSSAAQMVQPEAMEPSQDAYLNLLDYYDTATVPQSPSSSASPAAESWPRPQPERSEGQAPPPQSPTMGPKKRLSVHRVHAFLRLTQLLADEDSSHKDIYDAYQAIPEPRAALLPKRTIRRLLQRLSVQERKSVPAMVRLLIVADEIRAAGFRLKVSEWTSAMSFAARCLPLTSSAEVESALQIFHAMETKAGQRGNGVTLHVLFDMATKARKFGLAELVLREMRARGCERDRFDYVALIYYYGERGDGDGVRAAYRELVERGEIVDTVVLNCVIASLLRAGEAAAAEQVYERMKAFHSRHGGARLPPDDWRARRSLRRALKREARAARGDAEQQRRNQESAILAPDLHTCRLMLEHYCLQSGELKRAVALLNEMQWYSIPLDGTIFLVLFRGFSIHGGTPFTDWSARRLEDVWRAYLNAVTAGEKNVYLGKWNAIWCLRAFARCAGKDRVVEVWEDMRRRWPPHPEELASLEENVQRILWEMRHS